jgi:hypothetical protein
MNGITKSRLAVCGLAVMALAVSAQPAPAAKKPSCTRGGAKLVAADGPVRVVRDKVRKQSSSETRREHVYACWAPTGRRITIAREIDNGLDNVARTRVEIVDERFVGVRAHNEGGVSEAIAARVYDVRTRKLVNDSSACDGVDQGDFSGAHDVAFLPKGGLAIACRQLILYRSAGAEAEQLEPLGTDVRQLAVTRHSHFFTGRLFWTVGNGDESIARSLSL